MARKLVKISSYKRKLKLWKEQSKEDRRICGKCNLKRNKTIMSEISVGVDSVYCFKCFIKWATFFIVVEDNYVLQEGESWFDY